MFLVKRIVGLRVLYIYSFAFNLVELGECTRIRGGKGGNQGQGKGKGKKGQRHNEITEPPEEQWTSGSWDQWSDQPGQTDADSASWREDDRYTADSNSQASAAAEEFQHASFGDLRLSSFGF